MSKIKKHPVLEVPVSTLLGETVVETKVDDLKSSLNITGRR